MATESSLHEDLLPFRMEVRPERERVTVVPVGELDMGTTPALEQEVREMAERGFDEIVVDLRQLRFIDSTGLRLLLILQSEIGSERFGVVDGSQAVSRLLDLTGMRDHLRMVS